MFDIKHKSTIKIELKRAARVYLRIRPPINFISRKVHFITYTWARKKQHRNPDDKRLNRPGARQYRPQYRAAINAHARAVYLCVCMHGPDCHPRKIGCPKQPRARAIRQGKYFTRRFVSVIYMYMQPREFRLLFVGEPGSACWNSRAIET